MSDRLALRRQKLLARCAEQRVELALDLHALRASGHHARPLAKSAIAVLGTRLLANKRLALGTVLALVLIRPARLLRVARLAASGWRIARQGLALAARFRRAGDITAQ